MADKTFLAFLLGFGIGAVSVGGLVCTAHVKSRLKEISCVIDVNNDGLKDIVIEVNKQPIAFIQNPNHSYTMANVAITSNGLYAKLNDRIYDITSCVLLPKNH